MKILWKIPWLQILVPIFLIGALPIVPGIADEKEKAAESRFEDLEGNPVTPLQPEKGKPAVVIFITTDCPIANGYAPEINRIVTDYSAKGVKFTLVQVDPGLSKADAAKHAGDYGLKAPVVIDRKHELVKATAATVTPEAAVVGADGKVAYLGRINDRYAGFGDRRAAVTEHNLRGALDALLAGKPVLKARVEPIGCFIPDLD